MDNSVFSLAPEELAELRRKAQVRNLPRQALVVSEGDRTDSGREITINREPPKRW